MDIGCVVLDRLRQDGVDELDDRRLIVAFEQVRRLGKILSQMRQISVVFHATDHLHGRVRSAFVLRSQQLIEGVAIHSAQL